MITSIVGRLIKKPELVERIHIPGKKVVAFTLVQNSQRGSSSSGGGEKRLSVFFNLSLVLATEAQYDMVMSFEKGTVLLFSSPRITYVKQVEKEQGEQVINLYAEVENFRIVAPAAPGAQGGPAGADESLRTMSAAAAAAAMPGSGRASAVLEQQSDDFSGFGDDDAPSDDAPSFDPSELSDPFEEEPFVPAAPLAAPAPMLRSRPAPRAAAGPRPGAPVATAAATTPPDLHKDPVSAADVVLSSEEEELVALEGNTYGIRAELKALGAVWDGKARVWRIAHEKAAQARALIDSQPPPDLVKEGGAAATAGDELPDPFEEEAEPLVALTGNSYAVKDALRTLGARWDKEQRAWVIRQGKAARAQALIDAAAAADVPTAASAAAARMAEATDEA